MKNLIKGVLFLALVGTFIIGCEKEDAPFESSSSSSKVSEIVKQKSSTFSNKSISNPYNWEGLVHNNALDNCISNSNLWDNNGIIDETELYQTGFDYFITKVEDYENFNETALQDQINSLNNYIDSLIETESAVSDIINSADVSEDAKNYLTDLLNIESDEINVLIDSVEYYENLIVDEPNFEGKELCLVVASVYRNSLNYWDDELSNPNSPWNGYDLSSAASIAGSDAVGALVGGVWAATTLGPGSLVFGPGGVVLTIAGGAVVGAIRGSIGGAILSFF